ncbi:MAG: hypothetical protein ACPGJV_12790 [Bacteriovoracaceae bacterium]
MKPKQTITSTILYQIRKDASSLIKAAPSMIFCLDWLEINCGEINVNFIEDELKLKRYFSSSNYRDGKVYESKTKKGFRVSIYKGKYKRKNESNSFINRIAFNPSQLSGYSELEQFLEKIIIKNKKHQIHRIDYSFKFNSNICSVDSFFTTASVMNKQICSKYYKNKLRSGKLAYMSYGKLPLRITCYDRNGKPKHKKPEPFINFEIQTSKSKNKKLPIKIIQELPKLLQFNPLKTVHFYDQKDIAIKSKNGRYKTGRRFVALNYKYGFTMAKTLYHDLYDNYDRIKKMSPALSLKSGLEFKELMLNEYKKQLTKYLNS